MKRWSQAVFLSLVLLVVPLTGCASLGGGDNESLIAPEQAHVNAKKTIHIATKIYDRTAKKAAELYSAMPPGDARENFKASVISVGDQYLKYANAAKFAIDTHQTESFGGSYAQAYNYLLMLINAVQQAMVGSGSGGVSENQANHARHVYKPPVHRPEHPMEYVREMNAGCTEWRCKTNDGYAVIRCPPPPP